MQFKVPQDVLRADKIVGFLTLRQLIIVMLGGGIAYALYVVLNRQYVVEIWLPPVAIVLLITAAFAFFRFHDLAFEKMILLFIEYNFKPRARKWQKMQGDTVLSVLANYSSTSPQKKVKTPEMTEQDRRKKLEEISKLVDTHAEKLTQNNKNIP